MSLLLLLFPLVFAASLDELEAAWQTAEASQDLEAATAALVAYEQARAAAMAEDGTTEALLGRLTELALARRDWAGGLVLAQRAVELASGLHGETSAEVGTASLRAGFFAMQGGQLAAAETHLLRAREALLASRGPLDAELASVDTNLAVIYANQGRSDRAYALLEQTLAVRRGDPAVSWEMVANSLLNLGVADSRAGRHDQAEARFAEALALAEEASEPAPAVQAELLEALGDARRTAGRLVLAEQAARAGLALTDAGEAPPQRADLLRLLGHLALERGAPDRARTRYEQALEQRIRLDGEQAPSVHLARAALASAFTALGDHSAAAEQLEGMLDSEVAARLPPDARLTAQSNLAQAYLALGRTAQARALMERTIAEAEATFGQHNSAAAAARTNLGTLLTRAGEYAAAISLLTTAREDYEALGGPEHPMVGRALFNLAGAQIASGDLSGGSATLEAAYALLATALGPEHPDMAPVLRDRASLAWRAGRTEEARAHIDAALAVQERQLGLLGVLSDREGRRLLAEGRRILEQWIWMWAEVDPEAALTRSFVWKAAGTRSLAERVAAARASDDTDSARVWTELGTTRRSLAQAMYATPQEPARIAELTRQKSQLERLLSASGELVAPTVAQVCEALSANGRLVDLVRYTEDGEAVYAAFVLNPSCEVQRVGLGDAASLDEAVAQWRDALSLRQGVASVRGAVVRDRIWTPLAPLMGEASDLFVIPEGALSALPWAALATGTGEYLVEHTTPYLLPWAGALLTEADAPGRGTLSVGGVAYGDAVDEVVNPCTPGPFAELPGTLAESEALAHMLRGRHRPLTRLQGAAATESQVLERASGKALLHLATHGFFASDACASSLRDTARNPMLQSGLALSGANLPTSALAVEDGVLTAEEVAGADLRGTELVLLSACETGLGVTYLGEGVLGLQRGFSIAGAQSTVMSLWTVGDEDTAWLMGRLVREVGRGHSGAEALARAQRALLRRQRASTGVRPSEWAAWVVSDSARQRGAL